MDNAAGAVSRMVLALGSHLPVEQVGVPPSASSSVAPMSALIRFVSLFLSYHFNADPSASSRSTCYLHRVTTITDTLPARMQAMSLAKEGVRCTAQVVPVLLGALPLKEDMDEVAPISHALAAMLLNPELAARLGPFKGSLLQVANT